MAYLDNLEAYYALENNLLDSSGNGNHLTTDTGVTFNTNTNFGEYCADFSAGYAQMDSAIWTNFSSTTWAIWFWPFTGTYSLEQAVSIGSSTNNRGYSVATSRSNPREMAILKIGAEWYNTYTYATAETWNCMILVLGSDFSLNVYHGVEGGSLTNIMSRVWGTVDMSGTTYTMLGDTLSCNNYMNEIGLWNRELDATDRDQYFNEGLAPSFGGSSRRRRMIQGA